MIFRSIFWGALLAAYSLLIYWLSSAPLMLALPAFSFADKAVHFLAYGVLAMMACEYLYTRQLLAKSIVILAIVYASLYGLSDEWHQSHVIGRDGNLWDWLADTAGAVVMTLIWYQWIGRKRFHG